MMYIGDQKYVPLINNNKVTPASPDHYDAELEYLESTGTQYINTNIIPSNSAKFIIDQQFTSIVSVDTTNGQNSGVMIGTTASSGGRFHIGIYQNMFHFGFGTKWINTINADLNRHVFKLQARYAYIDDTAYSIENSSLNTNGFIYIFIRNNGSSLTTPEKTKIFTVQIYEGNILVRNYIPVRVGQVGYLYDKVSGRLFGNKGTGEFILGPDKI